MASIYPDPKSGFYYIRFRFEYRNFNRSLRTKVESKAVAAKSQIEERLSLLERRLVELNPRVDPIKFVLSNDRSEKSVKTNSVASLSCLFDTYFEEIPDNAKEKSTLDGERKHKSHLLRHLGCRANPQFLTTADLQHYVKKRSLDKYRKKLIQAGTIEKELTTFKMIWNWAVKRCYLSGPSPTLGVKLPKRNEKPKFRTQSEILKMIERGGLTGEQIKDLWKSVFLTSTEINRMLNDARLHSTCNFAYPMIYFVAHTGARRSEVLRSRIDDFCMENRIVAIREKKKVHNRKITLRHVEMSEGLYKVMSEWFENHPGGQFTICHDPNEIPFGLDDDEQGMSQDKAHYHFKKTLAKSWSFVGGFHVLRHSFASNLAAGNVDQRVIDEWMGHQTEAMRKRYRHLFPKQSKSAIDSVFGGNGE